MVNGAAGGKGTILVVDDDRDLVEMTALMLSKQGFTVYRAGDGAAAIELADNVHPDVIIMDITMPVMDGYQAARRIKENPRLKDTLVIFLTGKTPQEDNGRAFAHGGAAFLRKPFSPQQLGEVVQLAVMSLQE